MTQAVAVEPLRDGLADERAALALYVHWPFCISKCPYCDFNSHVRDKVDQQAWRQALLQDLAYEAQLTRGHRLGSIFFGGGTPSLMPPETVARIIEAAGDHWEFAENIEITLEANPSSVESARFADLALAGINRVSLGLQSLDDERLRFLGRAHDLDEGLAALDIARRTFDRASIDLIYALPDQDEAAWLAELQRALDFGTDHLSLYQLTIEPGTRFATLAAKGELLPLSPERSAALFELTRDITTAAGRPAYEISNHARPGQESRHNLAYWRYHNYCGVGPGAHGRRGDTVTQRHRKPENWLASVARHDNGISEEVPLTPPEMAAEAMLMGLRLYEGVDLDWIADRTCLPVEAFVDRGKVGLLQQNGLLDLDGTLLRVTASGALLLDAILAEIVRLPVDSAA